MQYLQDIESKLPLLVNPLGVFGVRTWGLGVQEFKLQAVGFGAGGFMKEPTCDLQGWRRSRM